MIKDLFGMPVVEDANLPKGTAYLIIQDKGIVKQMVKVFDELQGLSAVDLIAELEKRRPCGKCISWKGSSTPCISCVWKETWGLQNFKDNFKEAA